MRVFFINLHCNTFIVKTFAGIIVNKDIPTRHRFLVDELLKKGVKVYNYVTSDGSTMPYWTYARKIKSESLSRIEAKFVLNQNGLDNVINISERDQFLFNDDDIIVIYQHIGNNQYSAKITKGIVVADLSHFYGGKEWANKLRLLNPEYYLCEIDLRKFSKLFQKNYYWFNGGYLRRDFPFEERFKIITPFDDRLNRVCAMGNIARMYDTYEEHREFRNFYHTRYMQPQRKKIMDHQWVLSDFLDCYCTVGTDSIKLHKIYQSDYWIVKQWKLWSNFFADNRYPRYYHSFDMVETLNKYKIVVCPEDANGFYPIGAIEAMACGCVLLGQDYGVYEDLGLKEGFHYIGYDGSLEDMQEKAHYYLRKDNRDVLKTIAKNGSMYVRSHFSQKILADVYFSMLRNTVKDKNN